MLNLPPYFVDLVLALTLTLPVPLFALLGSMHQRKLAKKEVQRMKTHLRLHQGGRR